MRKHLLLLLFAFVASTSLLGAESGTCGDNLTWDLSNGILTISGTGAMYDYDYATAPWNGYQGTITQIIINEGVTYIGRTAFWSCLKLTSVIIPNSVTSIGDYAFIFCCSLMSFEIPNSVTSIGDGAFTYVPNIVYNGTAIRPDWGWGERCYNGYVEGYLVYSDNSKTELRACSALATGDIEISNSVTSIGYFAFGYCTGLTSVTIPNSVTSIGSEAFYECSNLTSMTIGTGVTSVGNRAFENCSSLTKVSVNSNSIVGYIFGQQVTEFIIGDNVTSIGNRAFFECGNLTSVAIGNSVTSIGEYAFSGCRGLTSVTIGNSVTSIGDNAFIGCSSLTSVHISDIAAWCEIDFSNESANPLYSLCDHYLYMNDELITDLVIPNIVTSIGQDAFFRCINLISVTVPNSVTSIGEYAFSDCRGLTSIEIPNSVTSIGRSAFYRCSSLSSIINYSKIPQQIDEDVFYNVNKYTCKLYVPEEGVSLYRYAVGWGDFLNIEPIQEQGVENPTIDSKQSTKTIREGHVLIQKGDNVYTLQGQEVK